MKPFVGIGITTYLDISSVQHGAVVFEAYEKFAPTLAPDNVRIHSLKFPVSDAQSFANHWRTEAPFEVREDRGRGALVERGNFIIGAEWRRAGRGGGEATFRPEMQNDRPDCLLIKHPYSVGPNWLGLFRRLVDICRPSYAMLHLFTEEEVKGAKGDRFKKFDGPFAGEEHFVSWRSSLGEWRKPDKWQHEERRTYRFLPNLSWANFLGLEFAGQFEEAQIERKAANISSSETGLLFTVTDDISDALKDIDRFEASRRNLRAAFKDGFFRT
mgnify:CR=1 FL=1